MCSKYFYLTLEREAHLNKNSAGDFRHTNLIRTKYPKTFFLEKAILAKSIELKENETLSDIRRHFSPRLSTGREQSMQKAYIAKSSLEMAKEDNRKKRKKIPKSRVRSMGEKWLKKTLPGCITED